MLSVLRFADTVAVIVGGGGGLLSLLSRFQRLLHSALPLRRRKHPPFFFVACGFVDRCGGGGLLFCWWQWEVGRRKGLCVGSAVGKKGTFVVFVVVVDVVVYAGCRRQIKRGEREKGVGL